MTDEVQAAVAAEVAAGEAQAATEAAIVAEQAAAAAVAEAATIQQVADREVANAALDAEQRVAQLNQEMEACRAELQGLRSQLTEMQTANLSIQETLTRLSWLEEVEATMTEERKEAESKAPPSAESSKTDGGTSDSDGGKTSNQESKSGEESHREEKQPDSAVREAPEPAKAEAAPKAGGKRHRWL